MCNKINFIKIFDEQVAIALSNGGFSYITEKINNNQTVFAFESTPELVEAISTLDSTGQYSRVVAVEDDTLSF